MTEREFLELAKKYLEGNCTAEEKALLQGYSDDISLLEEHAADVNVPQQQDVYRDILNRLNRSVNTRRRFRIMPSHWLKIAAVLCVVLLVEILFYAKREQAPLPGAALNSTKSGVIKPGGNNAYLTLSDGTVIQLNDARNGNLGAESDVRINKADSGLLVYVPTGAANSTSALKYNTITTPAGAQYQVVLPDGTKVWLNAASSIRFPVAFSSTQRAVEITGEVYFEVARNPHAPFMVSARGVEVKVLGTHFNVAAYADDSTVTTSLLEGSVLLRKGTQSALLAPGQQGIASAGRSGFAVSRSGVEEAVAWKNGLFIFHDEHIEEVMKKIARWYNVEVEYRGDVKSRRFGGTVSRYDDIADFMDIMKLTGSIDYKIEGRKIIVTNR